MKKGRASVIEERGMKVVGRSRIEKREIAGAGFGGRGYRSRKVTRNHPRVWGLVMAKHDSAIARSPGTRRT